MGAKLVFLSGENREPGDAQVVLGESTLRIGRHPDEDLSLPEEPVSENHSRIRWEDGRYILKDVGSRSGTFVNDRKIDEYVLQTGDLVEFGLGGPLARFEMKGEGEGDSYLSVLSSAVQAAIKPEADDS
jgi:pSer/pThr/pTyr-binding forkhead associated (FHA) protein